MNGQHDSTLARRRLLMQGLLLVGGSSLRLARAESHPGAQAFVARAFEMRDRAVDMGDRPYGAVIVRGSDVVGFGPSRVIVDNDPTAHAEVVAVRDACTRLATRDLGDCVMYSTSPPCPMCETAAHWANVSRFYHGRGATDGGRPSYPSC